MKPILFRPFVPNRAVPPQILLTWVSVLFIFGNFLQATATVLDMALTLYMWIIIIRALLSWVNPDPYNPIVQFLHRATDPLMDRIRRVLPMSGMGIDFSPIIVIMGIFFLRIFVVQTLSQIAMQMQ